ncbi:hypothetical protein K3495_g9755 [Podosphaera aphanis]|nr:hypothetical protein K3495_g9755 [Podosphaera aphanis]
MASTTSPSSIADVDYFAFTPENVRESEYADWYSNWTLERENDPRWKEMGEWRLFALEYFHTRDFECGIFWTDCRDMPSRFEIQTQFPNNRELARRVYFTSESYTIMRNYFLAVRTILDEVHMSLYGLLPEIVTVFTNQPDPSAKAACGIITGFIDTLINSGVAALTGMMTSTITNFYDHTKVKVKAAMKDPVKAANWHSKILESEWVPTTIINWLKENDHFNAWGEITPANDAAGAPRLNYPPHAKPELVPSLQKIKDVYDKAHEKIPWVERLERMPANLRMGLRFYLQGLIRDKTRLHLESSSLPGDGFCARFGGNDVSSNAANINQVQGQLASVFPKVLDELSHMYEGIYNGSMREHDQPSWLAVSMLSHNWAEEKSYMQRLRHGTEMKHQVMREFTLNIASQVSAKDGSYMKCTHKSWATEKCDRMAHAKATDKAALAYFCPRPETEPGLICQVGRWAFSADFSHETPWPALLKLEKFAENQFKLTRLDVLNAAYDYYELHGNDLQVDWNSWFLGSLSSLTSFTMPVCKHDDLAMRDNIVHGALSLAKNSKAFPNVCGEEEGETEDFFYELDILEGSVPWKSRSRFQRWAGGGTNEFYNDRLVKANQDMFRMNPFLRYRAMCYQHIRFAQHKDWKQYDAHNLINHLRVHKGRDQDCDLVLDATTNMTTDEANCWFCQKHPEYGMDFGHTVFARETWKAKLNWFSFGIPNHEKMCGQWLSQKSKTPMRPVPVMPSVPVVPPIPGVPRNETGVLWLEAMEFKKQYDQQVALDAENKKLDAEAEQAFKISLTLMKKKEAKAAKKRHKKEQKEAKSLRNNIQKLVKAQSPGLDMDAKWLKILKYSPQDDYKYGGFMGFLKNIFTHPLELFNRMVNNFRGPLVSPAADPKKKSSRPENAISVDPKLSEKIWKELV